MLRGSMIPFKIESEIFLNKKNILRKVACLFQINISPYFLEIAFVKKIIHQNSQAVVGAIGIFNTHMV